MKRPVSIVTGFLGSGKTTLLARVLSEPAMQNTAVLVNEFGEVGLDHHLLRRVGEYTALLGNGCVCCSTREDLLESLLELLGMEERGEIPRLERVVVETTGLADPAPVLFTVFSDPVLQHHFEVDLVISTVDAVNGSLHLNRNPESVKQVAAADKVVVTKTDIADPHAVEALISRVRTINPATQVIEAAFGEVGSGELFRREAAVGSGGTGALSRDSHSATGAHTVSLTFDGAVDWAAFGVWLSMLLHARGEEVLRVKGLLDVGEAGPVVLNGVQHVIHPPEHLDLWPDTDRHSRIIFIARGVEAGEILDSLDAFGPILGARARPLRAGARA